MGIVNFFPDRLNYAVSSQKANPRPSSESVSTIASSTVSTQLRNVVRLTEIIDMEELQGRLKPNVSILR